MLILEGALLGLGEWWKPISPVSYRWPPRVAHSPDCWHAISRPVTLDLQAIGLEVRFRTNGVQQTPHHVEVARRVKAEIEACDDLCTDVDHRSQPRPAERQPRLFKKTQQQWANVKADSSARPAQPPGNA
jgi:hypothetical protein